MEFNFLEYFNTDKYDEKIIIKNSLKSYCVSDIKKLVSYQAEFIQNIKNKNIILNPKNCFDFIITFLACILTNKNIYLINSNNTSHMVDDSYEISSLDVNQKIDIKPIKKINYSGSIFFYTSGTTSEPKIVEKTTQNLFNESYDILSEFSDIFDKNIEFITSAPLNHLYAITFYLFLGLNSKNIINVDKINYIENLKIQNSILVTSPSFLSYIEKNNLQPKIAPKLIFSAGAKLSDSTHRYFEKNSTMINILGSSETGIIAYKACSKNKSFKLFNGIKIENISDETIIYSNYSTPCENISQDKLEYNVENKQINILGRKDRIFKIHEKRVSADELESQINNNEFVKKAYLLNLENKIGAIVSLTNKGIDYLLKNGTFNLISKIKSNLANTFEIIPAKWKFINEIPLNSLGKIDTIKINKIFNLNLSIPFVIKSNINQTEAEYKLFFYKNCNFYKGHFDNFPITPGVVQLYLAAYFANDAFLKDFYIGQIKKIKFSSIIYPDTIVNLKLTKKDNNIVYKYYNDENLVFSSGSLPIKNCFCECEI